MRGILRKGLQAFEILEWYDVKPDDALREFRDKHSALEFLRKFLRDPSSINTFRKVVSVGGGHGDPSRLADHDVIEQLAWHLVSGRLKITVLPVPMPTWSYEAPPVKEEEPIILAPPVAEEPHWIEYRFVDAAGNPMSGLSYEFKAVDGKSEKGTLTQHGIIRRDGFREAGECNVELLSVTNAKWSQNSARVGDLVKLSADVQGYENGTNAVFEIWEMDIDGGDDFITKLSATVQDGKVESEWTYEYAEDTDEVTEEDEKKGYSSPEYYFLVKIRDSTARSDMLEFRDWIEIKLIDEDDDPVANEGYVLYLPNGEVRRGKLDVNGYNKEENIPPGKCQIEFPKQSNVRI